MHRAARVDAEAEQPTGTRAVAARPRSEATAAVFAGRDSCADLTDDDAAAFKQRLVECAPRYHGGLLEAVNGEWTEHPDGVWNKIPPAQTR